jgi:hypothetical protein
MYKYSYKLEQNSQHALQEYNRAYAQHKSICLNIKELKKTHFSPNFLLQNL